MELQKEFKGKGEVKGYIFKMLNSSPYAYIYEVSSENGTNCHYEIFKRKNVPICIDFSKRIYSETETKEIYPKSKDFGVWAWTKSDLTEAEYLFDELNITLD